MNTTSLGDLRHYKAADLPSVMPVTITVDGAPQFIMGTLDQVVVISDLHPHMRNKIKQLILRARRGMPEPEKVKPGAPAIEETTVAVAA